MPIFKICKEDPIVRMIRQTYKAIPVRNPSQLFQPMYAFSYKSGDSNRLGQLRHLLQGGDALEIATQPFETKTLVGQKTRRINTDLGLDMLGAFLKPLGLDTISLSTKLDSARQVSFSLGAVKGWAIDRAELGAKLGNFKVNTGNLIFNEEIKSGREKLMLIDSVLASSDFSFNVEKTTDLDFSFETPDMLNDFIDPDASVKVDASKKTELRFQTEEPLSFAFTCLELQVDWATGQFTGIGSDTEKVTTLGTDSAADSADGAGEQLKKIGHSSLGIVDGEMLEF